MSTQALVQSLKESILSQASVKAIYGEPISAHGKTVVPGGRSYVAKRCEACRNRIRPPWNVNFGRKMMAGKVLASNRLSPFTEQFRRGKEEHGGSAADCSRVCSVCSSGSQTRSIGPSTMATQEGVKIDLQIVAKSETCRKEDEFLGGADGDNRSSLYSGDGMNTLSKEVRDLIFQMVAENPSWGAPRIHVSS